MKKTIKQYSKNLDKQTFMELKTVAYRYGKVKNYIFSRYGSINGLQYLRYPREIRDEFVKTGFAKQWKLTARYWKLAFEEAFANIKTNWEQTKQSVKSDIAKRGLSDKERYYTNYILKANDILHKILTYKQYEINDKFNDLNQEKLNKLIRRFVRKYHHKSLSKKFRTFTIDADMYSYGEGFIEITSLKPRQRLKIELTDNIQRKGNIKVVLKDCRLELHTPTDTKIKDNNNSKTIAVDKGFRDMLAVSTNRFYGKNLSSKLIKLSDSLNNKNKQRNKLRSLVRKLEEKSNYKKANKIKKRNLGTKKYNSQKVKAQSEIKSFVNKSINDFINIEKPKKAIFEDLSFVGNKGKFKKVNRWLNSWIKGYIQERLDYKLSVNNIELAKVNPAYTSQICHLCHRFGRRENDKFYCDIHGVVNADYNASKNIEFRYSDSEISLFTPYKKVKEILLSRLGETNSTGSTKNRDTLVGDNKVLSFSSLSQSDSELRRNVYTL